MTPQEIATKLYQTIPLVPSGCLIQDIIQDVQYGLYDDCGDPNTNWDKYKERCKELLKQRNIVSKKSRLKQKLAFNIISRLKVANKIKLIDILDPDTMNDFGVNTDYGNRASAVVFLDGQVAEGEIHKEILAQLVDQINSGSGFIEKQELQSLNLPIALASKIIGIDGNTYISIYTDSVTNTILDEVKDAMKNKFPNAIICKEDDRYSNSDDSYIETI